MGTIHGVAGIALLACGVISAGLAAIHFFICRHPSVIGPFALPIGMTPLVMLFEYSLAIPAFVIALGTALAVAAWRPLSRNPPYPMAVLSIFLGVMALVGVAVAAAMFASVHDNVGMTEAVPAEWED